MSLNQTEKGKAFEYACLLALYNALSNEQNVMITDSPQLQTAKGYYYSLSHIEKDKDDKAADAAIRFILEAEPKLKYYEKENALFLSLQSDAQGQKGDVRDVLCVRNIENWEIGISCKHNHSACKHSRLSATIDFGLDWFGHPCSEQYFDTVKPIFGELKEIQHSDDSNPILWRDLPNKVDNYYVPILNAFMDEIKLLNATFEEEIPEKLVKYLLGEHDFYKVISKESRCCTVIEAININGSLNMSFGNQSPLIRVPKVVLPTKFYHVDFMSNKKNTIEIVCDNGWAFSMRIHNASSKVEPSLKFDVQLISTPQFIFTHTEPW